MKKYIFKNNVTSQEIKEIRVKLGLTQQDFAVFCGVSKTTVERWEKSQVPIDGPISFLVDILQQHDEWIEERLVPKKKYPLRMWHMYKDQKCTLIDVDEINEKIAIKNYVSNIMFRAFGSNKQPDYDDYIMYLKSRCFPETRDKIKVQLEALGIPFYDPLMIIEKTQGRMAEDDFWIDIER